MNQTINVDEYIYFSLTHEIDGFTLIDTIKPHPNFSFSQIHSQHTHILEQAKYIIVNDPQLKRDILSSPNPSSLLSQFEKLSQFDLGGTKYIQCMNEYLTYLAGYTRIHLRDKQ